jgi:AraC family transcriptional regulator
MEASYPSGRFYMQGLTLAVASRLVACHSSAAKPRLDHANVLSGHRLKQVLAFIEEQLVEDLSVNQTASVADVSASHANILFRNAVGR